MVLFTNSLFSVTYKNNLLVWNTGRKCCNSSIRNLYMQYKYGFQSSVIDPTPLMNNLQGIESIHQWTWYRIAGNFRWCKFSYELGFSVRIKFRSSNFRIFYVLRVTPRDTRWPSSNFSTHGARFLHDRGDDTRLPRLQRYMEVRTP